MRADSFQNYNCRQCISTMGKRILKYGGLFGLFLFIANLLIPYSLPDPGYSTLLLSKEKRLLGATTAGDGQWRFPAVDTLPYKYESCITLFEDEYFRYHMGINPVSVARALRQNLTAGKIISGASTLSMQTIRLSYPSSARTYWQKINELFLVLRLEAHYTKDQILNHYSALAPFGGNVVGLEAASWRYFGVAPHQLSWAESATLAVLPNAPGLIFPGRAHRRLLEKRNFLLKKLFQRKIIEEETYQLALLEQLPAAPLPLPQIAPHLLMKTRQDRGGVRMHTTIDFEQQQKARQILEKYHKRYAQNSIHNGALLLLDIENNEVLAYVGNTFDLENAHSNHVDIIQAPRSTGSILKPILHAKALEAGIIAPHQLLLDIPTDISGFAPENFNRSFDGLAPADEALARSLNIPFVRMLKAYSYDLFLEDLHRMGYANMNQAADHYGLSLILGGAEASLWEICSNYSAMARSLREYNGNAFSYFKNTWQAPHFDASQSYDKGAPSSDPIVDAGALYLSFKAMQLPTRPENEIGWQNFSSSPISWKTGTSFGFRDAWTVAFNSKYLVGIWIGNADGEGRPGLTGVSKAAPLAFELLRELDGPERFEIPFEALQPVQICRKSGFIAGASCPDTKESFIPFSSKFNSFCPYHQTVHLDQNEQYRVSSSCYPVYKMKHVPWFVLPPQLVYYYKKNHLDYRNLPPVMQGCSQHDSQPMSWIYPLADTQLFTPKDFDGKTQKIVFEMAHERPGSLVYWYWDKLFLGTTSSIHKMAVMARPGKHKISCVDAYGNQITKSIQIL